MKCLLVQWALIISFVVMSLAAPRASLADELDPAVQLGWGHVIAPAGWLGGPPPDGSGPMTVVGFVESFHPVLGDLDPGTDPEEYTFAFHDVGFDYSVPLDDPEHGMYGWAAIFTGGALRIHKDATPDAAIGTEASFEDGELLLEASIIELYVAGDWYEPTWWGTVRFTGGSLFPIVSSGGVGYVADNTGSFVPEERPPTPCGGAWPSAVACTRSALSLAIPTGVAPATWGSIKNLYR